MLIKRYTHFSSLDKMDQSVQGRMPHSGRQLTRLAVSKTSFVFLLLLYSHLKNLTAIPPQIIIRVTMTTRGSHATSIGKPSEAALSNLIPCVSGRISAILCNAVGITSYGSVAPEKINIGKYKMLATILATFMLGATPPTITPMLNVESITRR